MRLATIGVCFAATLVACGDRDVRDVPQRRTATGDIALPTGVQPTPPLPSRFTSIGRAASDAEMRAWDIDVNPTGRGLPPGSGSYTAGATVFAQKCAACHGAHGEGMAIYPRLIGRDPRDGFPFGQDPRYPKTIGNYWPYSTTLYDYIRRAMPLTAPGSLRSDEIYSLVAYLLAENEIIDRTAVMNANTLPAVRMPARGHFVADDRKGGPNFR